MENMIQEKIDRVLDGIQDPQTGMAISQMGLVEKFAMWKSAGNSSCFSSVWVTAKPVVQR